MVIGSLLVSVRLPGASSLKDKRRVVRSVVESLRRKFHVAAAEVDDQDLFGNATLGVAVVANNAAQVESVVDACLRHIEERPELELFDLAREIHVVR